MSGNSLKTLFARYQQHASTFRSARIAKSEQLKKAVEEEDDKAKSTQSKARTRLVLFPQRSEVTPSFRERMSAWWQYLFTPKKN